MIDIYIRKGVLPVSFKPPTECISVTEISPEVIVEGFIMEEHGSSF
jgi:hypothetical protein